MGFWGVFGVSSREGTHFWVPCSWQDRWASHSYTVARSAGQHAIFYALRAFGDVFGHYQVFLLWCIDVVLIDIVARTSFALN